MSVCPLIDGQHPVSWGNGFGLACENVLRGVIMGRSVHSRVVVAAIAGALLLGGTVPAVAAEPMLRPAAPIALTSPDAVSAMAGESVTVTGTVPGGKKGSWVYVQKARKGGWSNVSRVRLGDGGAFSAPVRMTEAGQFNLRAYANRTTISPSIHVDVLAWYYLSDLSKVDGDASSGSITMNGKAYPRSRSRWVGSYEAVDSWDLQRRCAVLAMTVGVDDKAEMDFRAAVSVDVDQAQAASTEVGFGTTQDLTVDVSAGLRLTLRATRTTSGWYGDTVGYGNARIACLPLDK